MNPKVTGRESPRFEDENLLYVATLNDWEGLYTGPKFGCVHFS